MGKLAWELHERHSRGLEYQIRIYDTQDETGEPIYESGILKAGTAMPTIEISKAMSTGEHTCRIECDVYRDTGVYIGQFTSQFNLLV